MTRNGFIRDARRALRLVRAGQDAQKFFAGRLGAYLRKVEAKALAEESAVSEQYISDVRHKRRTISANVLEKFAELETKS